MQGTMSDDWVGAVINKIHSGMDVKSIGYGFWITETNVMGQGTESQLVSRNRVFHGKDWHSLSFQKSPWASY